MQEIHKAEAIEAALKSLGNKAVEIGDLAHVQREAADAQQIATNKLHWEAHRLENLGDALEADIAKIKRKLA